MIVGTRVRLIHDEDRYPHFIAPKGATGVVVETADNIDHAVRLDENLPGAEEWGNEVHWFDIDEFDPDDVVEVILHPLLREEPEVVNSRWEEDPVILGAILNIQQAIWTISPLVGTTHQTPELNNAMADLEQAVRWLKGEEEPD